MPRFNLGSMCTVAEIIEAVKRLGVEEKREFLSRLLEVDFDDAWDRQIDAYVPFGTRPSQKSKQETSNLSMTSSTTPSFWRLQSFAGQNKN